MSSREPLEQRLSEFDAETVGAVIPPGADAVRRAVHRRERRRTVVAACAALVAVVSVVGLSTVVRPRPGVVIPGPSVTAPQTTLSESSSPRPDPSASTISPTTGTTSPTATGPSLRVTGPSSVTLQSDGTVYRGQFTLTVTNTGGPYSDMLVYLTTPAGVTVDSLAGDPGFGGCLGTAAPETWACSGPSIPAGGSVHPVIHLRADYGPQPGDVVLPGFAMRYSVGRTPPQAGNRVEMTIVLSGT